MTFQRRFDICVSGLTRPLVMGSRSRRPAAGPDSRRWPPWTPRSGPCRRSGAARSVAVEARDLAVDAAGRDDAVVDLQALEKLLHLLLLALPRQQDDEVEDRQDERRRERAAAEGCRPRHAMPMANTATRIVRHHESWELAGQALMERQPETFEPPKRYSVPNPPQGVKVKVQVMQRVKGGRVDLVRP